MSVAACQGIEAKHSPLRVLVPIAEPLAIRLKAEFLSLLSGSWCLSDLATPCPPQSARPQWDEFFAYELVSPAFAVLKISIMDYMRCWRPNMLGQVRSSWTCLHQDNEEDDDDVDLSVPSCL